MSTTHLFFDSIFSETHEELTDLQESFSEMQISFQLNSNFNKETVQEILVVSDTENESSEESDQETEVLSKEQIKRFENIYLKKNIKDDEIMESDQQHNMDIDTDNYIENLKTKHCCIEKECFKHLNYEEVKIR
jgi:hypothetical protein